MSKRPAATASFQFPFEGRPKSLQRTGLFLLNAEVYLKLAGMSPQAAFAGEGLSALYRRLKRLQGRRTVRPSIMLKIFTELFQRLNPPFSGDFDKALAGDAVAMTRIGRMGEFESALLGFGFQPEERKRRHWYLVVMERAGTDALKLVKEDDIPGAAQFTAEHPLLRHLLWPEALGSFRNASSELDLFPLITSLVLETHLGFLAAWDLDVMERLSLEASAFTCLFPSVGNLGRNPTSLFYDELQRRLGAKSIGDVLDTRAGSASELDQSTLNRWSAGTHFPDVESLKRLLRAYGMDNENEVLWPQFGSIKHLHLIGYLGQLCSNTAIALPSPGALWPWPQYPFGYPSFEAWTAARYPQWLAILREQGDALPTMATA